MPVFCSICLCLVNYQTHVRKAIGKYKEALNYVSENGTLIFDRTIYKIEGGNNIRSDIYRHIANAYKDLVDIDNANTNYDLSLKYNPNNKDTQRDRTLPFGARQYDNLIGESGAAAYEGGSLYTVVITDD